MALFKLAFRELQNDKKIFALVSISLLLTNFFYILLLGLTENLEKNLNTKVGILASADVIFHSTEPFSEKTIENIKKLIPDIDEISQSEELLTMLYFPQGEGRLVRLKTIEKNYPLRGEIAFEKTNFKNYPLLLPKASFSQTNGRIILGDATFNASFYQTTEKSPLLGNGMAPVVFLDRSQLKKTKLISWASRVHYYLYIRTDLSQKVLQQIQDKYYRPLLEQGIHFELAEDRLDFLRRTFSSTKILFVFFAISMLLLSLLALSSAINILLRQKKRNTAVLKSLGMTQKQIYLLYQIFMLYFLFPATILGLLLANLAFPKILNLFATKFAILSITETKLNLLQNIKAVFSIWLGAFLFTHLPLKHICEQSPIFIFKDIEKEKSSRNLFLYYFLSLSLFVFVLSYLSLSDVKKSFWLFLPTVGSILIFFLILPISLFLLTNIRLFVKNPYLRLALANLSRLSLESKAILVFTTQSFLILTTVSIVDYSFKKDLSYFENKRVPNLFVMDIQPSQKNLLDKLLQQSDAKESTVVPLISCRLRSLNGKPLSFIKPPQSRERSWEENLATREYFINYRAFLQPNEEIVQGKYWASNFTGHEVAVESEWAKTLQVKIGDILEIDIAGFSYKAKVSAIRRIRWEEMRPNSFLVFSPSEELRQAPQTLLVSFYLATEKQKEIFRQNAAKFAKNWTIIDVSETIKTVQQMSNQISLIIFLLTSMVLLAGLLLLTLTLSAEKEVRKKDAAILKILGSGKKQIIRYLVFAHGFVSLTATFLGFGFSVILVYFSYPQLFKTSPQIPYYLFFLFPTIFVIAFAQARWQSREILKQSSSLLLRQTKV